MRLCREREGREGRGWGVGEGDVPRPVPERGIETNPRFRDLQSGFGFRGLVSGVGLGYRDLVFWFLVKR